MTPSQQAVWRALLAMQRRSWEQGVASHAALDLGLDEWTYVLAHDAVLRQAPSGSLGAADEPEFVNGAAMGEAVAWAGRRTGDQWFMDALERQRQWLLVGCPRADDGTLFHVGHEVWTDTVYMVVPLLVALGEVDEAVRQVEGHRRRLVDGAGLYSARWDEQSQTFPRRAHWGTGIGWVAAGIARAMRLLPTDHSQARAQLAAHIRALLDATLPHRRMDGTFGDVIDDRASFSEVNLVQMLAYTCFTGVAGGWLADSYAEAGTSLLATADRSVDGRGLVMPVPAAPHFEAPGVSAEAQAFHLLAHTAAARLA